MGGGEREKAVVVSRRHVGDKDERAAGHVAECEVGWLRQGLRKLFWKGV